MMEGGGKRRTHPDHLPCDDKVRALGRARRDVSACAARRDITASAHWDGKQRLRFPGRTLLLAHTSCCGYYGDGDLYSPQIGLGDLGYLSFRRRVDFSYDAYVSSEGSCSVPESTCLKGCRSLLNFNSPLSVPLNLSEVTCDPFDLKRKKKKSIMQPSLALTPRF